MLYCKERSFITARLFAGRSSPAQRYGVNMNFSDVLLDLTQTAQADVPGLFPFPFTFHLVFSIIALVFFVFRFAKEKKPYQLIFAIAVPLSMIVWMSDRKNLFYLTGAIELVLIIAAFVSSIVCKPKTAAEGQNDSAESSGDTAEEE